MRLFKYYLVTIFILLFSVISPVAHSDSPTSYTNSQYVYPNGNKYVGQLSETSGLPHGKGTIYTTNGNRFEGEFFQGVARGMGTYMYSNGDIIVANFEKHQPTSGKYLHKSSGNEFRGSFVNWEPSTGPIYNSSGDVIGEANGGKVSFHQVNNQQSSSNQEQQQSSGVSLGDVLNGIATGVSGYMEGRNAAQSRQTVAPVIVKTPEPPVVIRNSGPPAVRPAAPMTPQPLPYCHTDLNGIRWCN
ncbi:MAG: hypothetical protein HOP26_07370 [Methylotenera sp.]|nr:hypothetical protein [Methylotenera sp.]